MRVWIVTYEPYYDNSEILAVFSSRDKALGAYPWADDAEDYGITEKRVDHYEPVDPPVVEPKRPVGTCADCKGAGWHRIGGSFRSCTHCGGGGQVWLDEVM